AKYLRSIKFLIKKRKIALLGFAVISAIGFFLMSITPTAFIPNEDDGFIVYSIKLPPGSSLARTTQILHKALNKLEQHDEIMSMSSSAGYNGVDGTSSSSYAVGYINMYPHGKRKGITDIYAFMDTLRNDLSDIKGAEITVYKRPTITGFGSKEGVHFVLEDILNTDFQTIGNVANDFIAQLNKSPGFQRAS